MFFIEPCCLPAGFGSKASRGGCSQQRGWFAPAPRAVNVSISHLAPARHAAAAEAFNFTRSLSYVKPPGDLFKQTDNASPIPKILRFSRNTGHTNNAGSEGFSPRGAAQAALPRRVLAVPPAVLALWALVFTCR